MTHVTFPKPTPKPPKERQRLKSRPHVIPSQVRTDTFMHYGYVCRWCGVPGGALDLHHRLPRSRGGKDNRRTLIPVHRICHDRIHDWPTEAYRRGFLVRSADDLDIEPT